MCEQYHHRHHDKKAAPVSAVDGSIDLHAQIALLALGVPHHDFKQCDPIGLNNLLSEINPRNHAGCN
jgi:hypothetical protein